MLEPKDFFDLEGCDHKELFSKEEAVWTALDRLQEYLSAFFLKDSFLKLAINSFPYLSNSKIEV